MVIEFARNVAKLTEAGSTEFDPDGDRTFWLRFAGGAFSYRAVGAAGLERRDLRAGMDAQLGPQG